ncbi:TIGR02646 family protein [Sphaerospermopsis aphanizomenoides]|uniref:TIGR02646 family protein n=1 Tax=Sphaerospermopsis aphanizomenoides TaxID=459663 RepID=UPI0018807366|nr:TIGR02646 family protein [Sphaerospermopsis aphanizomenoides]
MRWIQKKNEPRELIEWRVSNANDINFGYDLMRQDKDVTKAVTESLVKEQGWLCAYSGIRINGYEEVEANGTKYDKCDCHIDHVKAQDYCSAEEKVSYTNMVASYPGPNAKHKTPFAGEQKGNWPNYITGEQALFVSPLDQSCENRFLFNLKGEIKHKPGDTAAETTIDKLGLNDDELKKLRKGAIQGTIGLKNNLAIKDARNRLKKLQSQQEGRLEPFCFVLIQALEIHIKRLEYIAASKNKK